jgi:hypothetical protein
MLLGLSDFEDVVNDAVTGNIGSLSDGVEYRVYQPAKLDPVP